MIIMIMIMIMIMIVIIIIKGVFEAVAVEYRP